MLLTCGIMPYSRPNSFPSFGLRTKNVGEFNEYLREHDGVEQFVSISGIAIEEEKTFKYFTVYRKIVLFHLATAS